MSIVYTPYENLNISRNESGELCISAPWIDVSLEIEQEQETWIKKATDNLYTSPLSPEVQRFMEPLKDYFVSYIKSRESTDFNHQKLETQTTSLDFIDFSTPLNFLQTSGIPYDKELKNDCPESWSWNPEPILIKSKIQGTDRYDPLSFITALTLTRLEKDEEEKTESRQGLYDILQEALKSNEELFFKYMGWVSRQSYHITSTVCHKFDIPIQRSPILKEPLEQYRADEVGHHKFMEQTLGDLGFKIQDFEIGSATRFLVDSFEKAGSLSLFAFVCMISIFEPPIYLDKDPLSDMLNSSSKPYASKGYAMHYKINMEHNHAGVAQSLCAYLGSQPLNDCLLTVRLFELCLHLTSVMESRLPQLLNNTRSS